MGEEEDEQFDGGHQEDWDALDDAFRAIVAEDVFPPGGMELPQLIGLTRDLLEAIGVETVPAGIGLLARDLGVAVRVHADGGADPSLSVSDDVGAVAYATMVFYHQFDAWLSADGLNPAVRLAWEVLAVGRLAIGAPARADDTL
jgi:hypothetical protein